MTSPPTATLSHIVTQLPVCHNDTWQERDGRGPCRNFEQRDCFSTGEQKSRGICHNKQSLSQVLIFHVRAGGVLEKQQQNVYILPSSVERFLMVHGPLHLLKFFVDTFDFLAWEGGGEWNFQDRYRSLLDKFLIIYNCHGLTERFTVYDRHPKESLLKFPTDWKWVLWHLQAQSLFSHLVFAHSISR